MAHMRGSSVLDVVLVGGVCPGLSADPGVYECCYGRGRRHKRTGVHGLEGAPPMSLMWSVETASLAEVNRGLGRTRQS